MRSLIPLTFAAILVIGALPPVLADKYLTIEDFTMQPQTRWRFITDTGDGRRVVRTASSSWTKTASSFARMTGRVSTSNRGGFIQMRLDLASQRPEGTNGVRLVVRGNNQRYFVHLRTSGTILPWQYYQAGFDVDDKLERGAPSV